MINLMFPNLEAERARRGLNQTEMATTLGVTAKTYRKWITTGKIPFTKMEQIADFFKMSVDYLFAKTAA